jgi:alkylation response protein AidB-like acyl-CoA dehydrogenase
MKVGYSAEDEQGRIEIRSWLEQHFPRFKAAWNGDTGMGNQLWRKAWEDYLCAHGWSGLGWPAHYGGKEWTLTRQAIFYEELARMGAPQGVNTIGHGILGPTLIHFGNDWQRERFLPGILSNREVWCQGYSEPSAGSDLASLSTRAVRAEGGYRISGTKVWTSWAHIADWCFILARTNTDLAKHKGISFFLLDMRSPGVFPEPIRQMSGEAEFNEVRFEDVFVPDACRVGEENAGWAIAMAAASFERGTYFIPRLVRFGQEVAELTGLATRTRGAEPKGVLRDTLARLLMDEHLLKLKTYRSLTLAMRGDPPGPEGSSTKLHWSEAHQRLLTLATQLLGERTLVDPQQSPDREAAAWTRDHLWSRAETLLAGTSEIQRNIIAERILGLPRG